ncbi:hypothetical protein E7744_06935 [Citricoccus sp. SGAir0253]|uniref:hypothetical protein n=1 Tax=Citricoccus sp. SGAir0253 TaxID=2567881 RepID=UPI0010CCEB4C|nr:hypothetical protein [Citricoccus sp. SGAir0253]QCU77946.1 hypothetical protein E7744_06935 [Citricoccus sp. SGAir0253]
MIWLYITVVGGTLAIFIAFATRPIGAVLVLVQATAFVVLALGLLGWFVVLQEPVFLCFIGAGGITWLLTLVLRGSHSR